MDGQGKVVREVREEFGGKMLSRGQECVQDDPMLNRGLMGLDRKSTRLNSSHSGESRMPSSA